MHVKRTAVNCLCVWFFLLSNALAQDFWERKGGEPFAGTYGAGVFRSARTTPVEQTEVNEKSISFALEQNYPNPFNPATNINYELSQSTQVKLTIYNLLGQRVRTLLNQRQTLGYDTVTWDGKNEEGEVLAPGFYVCRLETQTFVQSRRMLMLK